MSCLAPPTIPGSPSGLSSLPLPSPKTSHSIKIPEPRGARTGLISSEGEEGGPRPSWVFSQHPAALDPPHLAAGCLGEAGESQASGPGPAACKHSCPI